MTWNHDNRGDVVRASRRQRRGRPATATAGVSGPRAQAHARSRAGRPAGRGQRRRASTRRADSPLACVRRRRPSARSRELRWRRDAVVRGRPRCSSWPAPVNRVLGAGRDGAKDIPRLAKVECRRHDVRDDGAVGLEGRYGSRADRFTSRRYRLAHGFSRDRRAWCSSTRRDSFYLSRISQRRVCLYYSAQTEQPKVFRYKPNKL